MAFEYDSLNENVKKCQYAVRGKLYLPALSFRKKAKSTDKASEAAILDVVKKNFSDHLILGEEGSIIGDASSNYLWCIDPLDGTTNFTHGYPSFAVAVGVLYGENPAAASVVEFIGGPMCWNTRTFSGIAGTM